MLLLPPTRASKDEVMRLPRDPRSGERGTSQANSTKRTHRSASSVIAVRPRSSLCVLRAAMSAAVVNIVVVNIVQLGNRDGLR